MTQLSLGKNMKILVTGAAGFIGFHLTLALIRRGESVVGVDNLNSYYDPELKKERLRVISKLPNAALFEFVKADIADRAKMADLFNCYQFDIVVNLAAQAGVRYSLENPDAYVDSNLVGFSNILEGCRQARVKHLVYASSSSVYGMNKKQPFSADDRVDHPVSLYAATKKSNELMAHSYSHLFRIPTTGLRFFTVYGPYGRPDMAYFKFTKAIMQGTTIDVYNHGKMKRDFTYIDDIIEGIVGIMDIVPQEHANQHSMATAPFNIYNIGNNNPISLRNFITGIENACGKKAKERLLPMQPGDVPETYADIGSFTDRCGFVPSTKLEEGIKEFVKWYRENESLAGK
jgi:UDP-glucuronate 4-epimerase